MPLVDPLTEDIDPEVRELSEFFGETLGFTPNSVLTMQRRPAIARAFIQLNRAVMENHGRVSSELKRLIGYVVSRNAGCLYCQAHTIRAAERYGGQEERLKAVWEFEESDLFNEAEKAVLAFALAASTVPNSVDAAIGKRLRKYWDDGEIVEILGVVSLFGYLNRWNDSMATPLEEDAAQSGEKYLKDAGWSRGKHA